MRRWRPYQSSLGDSSGQSVEQYVDPNDLNVVSRHGLTSEEGRRLSKQVSRSERTMSTWPSSQTRVPPGARRQRVDPHRAQGAMLVKGEGRKGDSLQGGRSRKEPELLRLDASACVPSL